MSAEEDIIVYTDGACKGNPGAGGWAAVIIDGEEQKELSAGYFKTTNNRMEYLAAIMALQFIGKTKRKIIIHTDSELLYNTMTKWIFAWQKKNWKKSDGKTVLNKDLVELLYSLSIGRNISWVKVKAHIGLELNERCDTLAVAAASKPTLEDSNYASGGDSLDLFSMQDLKVQTIEKKAPEFPVLLIENPKLILQINRDSGKPRLELINKSEPNRIALFPISDVKQFLKTIEENIYE